jgi:flagellar export protein FliJ
MKSRDTLIRLKRFQLEEKRRRVGQIEMMLAEFTRMIGDLDREIANEEKRAGIADPTHFAYPTYARATSVRRDNLKSSIAELLGQIEEAKAAQEEAEGDLLKFETLEVRDKTNDRLAEAVARACRGRVITSLARLPFLRGEPLAPSRLFAHFPPTHTRCGSNADDLSLSRQQRSAAAARGHSEQTLVAPHVDGVGGS